jgi:membrane protease YdiL (CAAX protease family)
MKSTADSKAGSHELFLFFIIAFALTWLLQVPRLLADNNLAEVPAPFLLLNMVAPFGPFIAAFYLVNRKQGRAGMQALWVRGWQFKVRWQWAAVILLLPLVTNGLTILIVNLLGGRIPWELQPLPPALAVPIFFAIYLTQALPEEYGWRGFALDRLQARWNALTASLVLGFLWGLWHLPLHFMTGTTQEVIPVPEFILKQMVGAIFYTWVYNNTNRNVFLAILMHAAWNVYGGLIPYWVTSQGRWINFSVELAAAGVIILYCGAQSLKRSR